MTNKEPVVIKKYPNRRLYNTETSCYVTLQDLADLIKSDATIRVVDVKTNEDLTRITLAQIILEQEQKGYVLLSNEALCMMIKFYNHPLAHMFVNYMQEALKIFNSSFDHGAKIFGNSQQLLNNPIIQQMTSIAAQNRDFLDKVFGIKK